MTSFIWSSTQRAAGGAGDAQFDFALPAATADTHRMLVICQSMADSEPTLDGGIVFSATFATDAGFTTGVVDIGPGAAGAMWNFNTSASSIVADYPLCIGQNFGWASIPDGVTGYVRWQSSIPLNQGVTVILLGEALSKLRADTFQQFFQNHVRFPDLDPVAPFPLPWHIGWVGSCIDPNAYAVPTDAIIVEMATTTYGGGPRLGFHSLSTLATWGQVELTNGHSAGGHYPAEVVHVVTYSFWDSGANQDSGNPFATNRWCTGAQWNVDDAPNWTDPSEFDGYRNTVSGAYFTNPIPTRKVRTFAHLVGV